MTEVFNRPPAASMVQLTVKLPARMALRMGERARQQGYRLTTYAELLLSAAWSVRFGQEDDPELAAAVSAAVPEAGTPRSGPGAAPDNDVDPFSWQCELHDRIVTSLRAGGTTLSAWAKAVGRDPKSLRALILAGKVGPKYRALIQEIADDLARRGVPFAFEDLVPRVSSTNATAEER